MEISLPYFFFIIALVSLCFFKIISLHLYLFKNFVKYKNIAIFQRILNIVGLAVIPHHISMTWKWLMKRDRLLSVSFGWFMKLQSGDPHCHHEITHVSLLGSSHLPYLLTLRLWRFRKVCLQWNMYLKIFAL